MTTMRPSRETQSQRTVPTGSGRRARVMGEVPGGYRWRMDAQVSEPAGTRDTASAIHATL